MVPRLQEQRIGDDAGDRGERQRARDHILRAVKQDAHRKTALAVSFHRSRGRATAATRHVVIIDPVRHFSSPDEFGPAMAAAMPASALRYCSVVAAPAAANR